MVRHLLCLLLAATLCATPVLALGDADLRTAVERRFKGDRSGACIVAAMIENGTTAKAYVCADEKSTRPLDDHTAFEIGSISKPMTAALLAEPILRGEIALDDPIAKLPRQRRSLVAAWRLAAEPLAAQTAGRPGTISTASPSSTGLPSTQQTHSKRTRRLAG